MNKVDIGDLIEALSGLAPWVSIGEDDNGEIIIYTRLMWDDSGGNHLVPMPPDKPM